MCMSRANEAFLTDQAQERPLLRICTCWYSRAGRNFDIFNYEQMPRSSLGE